MRNNPPTVPDSGRRALALGAFALGLVCAASGRVDGQTAGRTEGPAAPAPGTATANAATGRSIDPRHPLAPALKLARESRSALNDVRDYEAVFIKREQLGGQLQTQTMQLKLREQPFSVYLGYQEPNAGREILFVKGQNQNMLLAHEGSGIKSLAGTVSLAVDSPQARAENRHPITDLGMRRLVERVIVQWEDEAQYGGVEVQYYPDAKIGGVACPAIECSHPKKFRNFPMHVTRLYIDAESKLPVRLENYGYPPSPGADAPLIEEYTYLKIRTNVGLKDEDFSIRNPNYAFSR
ncbi:MAG: DUF1571 domain-containing protein [Planctomyces sp.]|nr:DUF1571 domain-containing protein [Planctomyces sp.]